MSNKCILYLECVGTIEQYLTLLDPGLTVPPYMYDSIVRDGDRDFVANII